VRAFATPLSEDRPDRDTCPCIGVVAVYRGWYREQGICRVDVRVPPHPLTFPQSHRNMFTFEDVLQTGQEGMHCAEGSGCVIPIDTGCRWRPFSGEEMRNVVVVGHSPGGGCPSRRS